MMIEFDHDKETLAEALGANEKAVIDAMAKVIGEGSPDDGKLSQRIEMALKNLESPADRLFLTYMFGGYLEYQRSEGRYPSPFLNKEIEMKD